MAVLVMDSYDYVDTIALNYRDDYQDVGGGSFNSSVTKWGTGNSYLGSNGLIYRLSSDQAGNTLIIGANIYIPSTASNNGGFFQIFDSTLNQTFAGVTFNYTTKVFTILGNTGTFTYTEDKWFHAELKIKVTNSTASGECVLKLNGTEDLNLTGVDTQLRPTNSVEFIKNINGNQPIYVDDFYILDTTGTYANDFLGPKTRIECLRPNGNGNYNDFLGSDADSTDNYLLVDDDGDPDGDTTYTESSTATDRDSYLLSNISGAIVGNPLAVQVNNISRKEGSNETRSINNFVRISSTNYDNSNVIYPPLDTFVATNDIYNASPATTNQWTTAEVNALEAGIEVNS